MFEYILGLTSLPILSVTVSLVISLTLFYTIGKRTEKALLERIAEIEKRSATLTLQAIPVTVGFQAFLVGRLTHFHTPEIDGLMEKLGPPFKLTEAEAARLDELLVETMTNLGDDVSLSEREDAETLRLVIRLIAREKDLTGMQAPPLIHVLVSQDEAVGK